MSSIDFDALRHAVVENGPGLPMLICEECGQTIGSVITLTMALDDWSEHRAEHVAAAARRAR